MRRAGSATAALALAATLASNASAQQAPATPTPTPAPTTPAAASAVAAPAAPVAPTSAAAPLAAPPPTAPPTQPVQATQPPAPAAPGPSYPTSLPAPPPYGYAPPSHGYVPPGYAAPGTGPGGFVPLPPPTLEYVEGQPIPPGYRVHTRTRTRVAIAGGSLFGGAYLLSVAMASVIEDSHSSSRTFIPLVVPVAGPFITIATAGSEGASTLLLVLDGLAQTSGVVMFIAGLASQDTVLMRNDLLGAVPEINVGPGGASARWRF